MMGDTQGNDPFIARLRAQSSGLGETDVMGLAWAPTADETRLAGDVFEVVLVADALGGSHRERCLFDRGSLVIASVGFVCAVARGSFVRRAELVGPRLDQALEDRAIVLALPSL